MMIELVCIVVYIISWFADVSYLGYTTESTFDTRFTYMFVHQNIIHLFLNLCLYRKIKKELTQQGHRILTDLAFIVAVLVTFGSEMAEPTIGLSAVTNALIASYLYLYWRKGYIILIGMPLILLVLQYCEVVTIRSNHVLHLLAVIYSTIITFLYEKAKTTSIKSGKRKI